MNACPVRKTPLHSRSLSVDSCHQEHKLHGIVYVKARLRMQPIFRNVRGTQLAV